jgi:hypothetical protein
MTVVKFPAIAARRIAARRPRRSKNGTPEERAAKAAAASTSGTVCMLPSRDDTLIMSEEEVRAHYEALSHKERVSISHLILALGLAARAGHHAGPIAAKQTRRGSSAGFSMLGPRPRSDAFSYLTLRFSADVLPLLGTS